MAMDPFGRFLYALEGVQGLNIFRIDSIIDCTPKRDVWKSRLWRVARRPAKFAFLNPDFPEFAVNGMP